MRQVARKGLISIVATSGALAVTGGYAYADSGASGASVGSPGVLSGNTVQVPINVPVNACGNTANVVGALNPAFGNNCANHGGHGHSGGGGASARGFSSDSPGIASGNTVQAPVHVPVNACGNTVDAGGALNPAFGNRCANVSHGHHGHSHGGGSVARGGSEGSPGIGSGNTVQAPVDVPVNVCGNSVDAGGALNPAFGNRCENGGGPGRGHQPPPPGGGQQPPPPGGGQQPPPGGGHQPPPPGHGKPPQHGHRPPAHHGHRSPTRHTQVPSDHEHGSQLTTGSLAHTGADEVGLVGLASVAMLAGGFVLYRRGRTVRA